jgi:biopolymer transport protein ExbD
MPNTQATAQTQAISEINVTPLVDVMLCLLIIFMIAAPMLSSRLPLALPQPTPPPVTRTEPEPPLRLRILADGHLLLEDQPIRDETLAAELAWQADRDPRRILQIDTDRQAVYQRFVDVLASAREQGISQIALAKQTPGGH